jgi:PAS domain S-box-containing protein
MFSTEKEVGPDELSVKNAQDRLDRLSSAFELFPSAVALLDVGGVIEYANPVFLSLGGYASANEVVGKKYSAFTDDAGAIRFAGEIIPALLTGNIWTGEFYQRKESGLLYVSYMMCSAVEVKKGERKHLLLNFYDSTERRKNESALKISDELLNLVLKSPDIGTWELDISRNKWTFSKPFLDFLGYSEKEVGNDVTFWERLIHADDLPKVSGALMSHLQAKTPVFECEYRVLAKSGEWKWVISRGKVMGWSPGGKPSRVLGIYNSIHEAKKNRESLKDIENKYRLVTEVASEGILIADEKSNAVYINSSMADMLGYHANEILGGSILTYVSEKSVDAFKSHLERIKQGIREGQELELKTKDGKTVYSVFETAPLIDDKGTYMGAIAVVSDITLIKTYESQIKEMGDTLANSEKKYEALAESVNEITFTADAGGTVRYISPVVTRILGFDAKDIVGIRFNGLVHPEDLTGYASYYNKILNGSLDPFEFRIIDKKGTVHFMRASGKALTGKDGSKSVSALLADITQYKKAEEESRQNAEKLRQSEEKYARLSENIKELKGKEKRYNQLMEIALEGIWIVDETSNISYVNYKMAEMLGYTVDELLGRHIYMFMDERAIESCKQGIEKSRQGLTESRDFEYRRKDGQKVYATISTSPLADDKGTYTGSLIVVSDKTRARIAEEKLAQSEDKFLKLLENIEDLFLSFNSKGAVTYAGCAVGRILGYETGDLVGNNLRKFVHPDDLGIFAGVFDASLKGSVAPYDFRLLDKQGSVHHMRGVSQVYVTSDGSKSLSMLLTDITDKKNAEELLRRTEKRFQDVLETEDEYIWETDAQIYYTFVSDKSAEVKGYTPQELIGRTILEHMPEEDLERFRKAIDESVSQKKPFKLELRTTDKQGATLWEEINGKPLYGLEGKFMGLRGAALNITQRKKAEEALREKESSAVEAIREAERKATDVILETERKTAEKIKETENNATQLVKETERRTSEKIKETENNATQLVKETERRTSEKIKETENNAAQIVKETERLNAEIIDFLPDATFVTNTEGVIISWNKAMEDLTGILSKDMLGKGASDYASVLSGKDKKPVRIDLSGRSKEEVESFGYHSVELHDNAVYAKACVESANGHAAYIWIKASPLLDSQGRKTGWITSLRDVTGKKKAKEELKDLHMRQKALLDNIPDMAWLKDENSHYIAVNEAFEKACGKKEDVIVGKTDREIWPVELAEKYAQDDALIIQSGKGRCVEEAFEEASLGRRWMETIKSPLFDESGKIVGIAGIARDVTDRKMLDEAVRGEEKKQPERKEQDPDTPNKRSDSVFRPFFKRK